MTDAPGCKYTPGDGGDPVRYRPTFDPFTPLRAANTFREEGWPNVSTAEEREHLFPRDTLSRVTPPCLSPPPPIFFRAYLRPFLCCTEYRLENDESFDLAGIGLKKKGALCVLTEEEWRKEIDNIYLFPNFLKFFRIKSGKEK